MPSFVLLNQNTTIQFHEVKLNDGYKIKNHSVFTNHYVDLFTISKLLSED